jgi:hypothetical protein
MVSRKNMLYTTKWCQGEERGEEVRSSRAHYLDVPIIPGEVVAVHIFLRPKMLASRSGLGGEMTLTKLNYQCTIEAPVPNGPKKL